MKTDRGFIQILGPIIALIAILGGGYIYYQQNYAKPAPTSNITIDSGSSNENTFDTSYQPKPAPPIGATYVKPVEPVACTAEAKICPDGSAVGRTGPKCEFAACPAPQIEQLIILNSIKPNDRVNITKPLLIIGQARKIFNEGEFGVTVSYSVNNQRKIIANTFATCHVNIADDGCDWTSGKFIDFKTTLDLAKSPVCLVNIEFSPAVAKDGDVATAIYTLPLRLYGNANCQ